METSNAKLLKLPEVAFQLGVGRSTVYKMLRQGDLPTVHIGKAVRVPAIAVAGFIADREKRGNGKEG